MEQPLTKRLIADIPLWLSIKLKKKAAEQNTTMKDILIAMLEHELSKPKVTEV